jgi:hypothetical protein
MTVRRSKRNNLGLHDKAQVGHIADLGPEHAATQARARGGNECPYIPQKLLIGGKYGVNIFLLVINF